MSELNNIVIVGASVGVSLAQDLAKRLPESHRVVLIEKNEHAFFPIAALRAAVVPGWEDKIHGPLDNVFAAGSRHVALHSTEVLKLGERSVVVSKAHPELGLGETIPFDYAVIATGSTYANPARPAGTSAQDIVAGLRKMQSDVASAESILVIGGGPVGVEAVGEIIEVHKDKKVTLVHSAMELVGEGTALHPRIARQLNAAGVRVVLDDKVDLPQDTVTGPVGKQKFKTTKGEEIEADFVWIAFGSTPNASLVASADADVITSSGHIKVLPSLQVPSSKLSHVFAIGDVTDLPENKMIANGWRHSPIVAANIVSLINGKAASATWKAGPAMMMVTFGSKGGAFHTPWFTLGAWSVRMAKGKTLFADTFLAKLKAD